MMTPLRPSQVQSVATLFAAAFENDPLYAYFFPVASSRRRQLTELCRFQLIAQGAHVRCTSDRLEGRALWIPPDARPSPNLRRATVGAAIRLARNIPWPTLWRMWRYDRFASRLRARLLPAPHWYLEVVGVAPDQQGKGFASRLIRPILERASREHTPCYLETQNEANLDLYQHYGFRIAAQVLVPGTSVTHYAMVRMP